MTQSGAMRSTFCNAQELGKGDPSIRPSHPPLYAALLWASLVSLSLAAHIPFANNRVRIHTFAHPGGDVSIVIRMNTKGALRGGGRASAAQERLEAVTRLLATSSEIAGEEQARGIDEISRTAQLTSKSTHQTAAGAAEGTASVQSMSSQVQELSDVADLLGAMIGN
jgi:hypothetical protein